MINNNNFPDFKYKGNLNNASVSELSMESNIYTLYRNRWNVSGTNRESPNERSFSNNFSAYRRYANQDASNFLALDSCSRASEILIRQISSRSRCNSHSPNLDSRMFVPDRKSVLDKVINTYKKKNHEKNNLKANQSLPKKISNTVGEASKELSSDLNTEKKRKTNSLSIMSKK